MLIKLNHHCRARGVYGDMGQTIDADPARAKWIVERGGAEYVDKPKPEAKAEPTPEPKAKPKTK